MAPVPEGARRSEDGFYWWDGSAWQEVPEDERVAQDAINPAGPGEMTQDELSRITSEDELDDRSMPYFQPDYDMYPDDDSSAEGSDVLSDEPAPDAAGGA